jgi:hypothetical protein
VSTAFQPNAFQSNAFQIAGGAAGGAVTVSFAATENADTGAITVTVNAVPVPITTSGGGYTNKSWRRKAKEARALREAIREALAQPDPVVVPVVVEAAQALAAAPERVQEAPNWDLPQPQDYSTEAAHIAALTQAVASIADAYSRAQAAKARDELTARRKAKVAKVKKLLMLLDLLDAA